MTKSRINLSYGENCELIVLDLNTYDIKYEESVTYDFIIYNKKDKVIDGPYIFNRTKNQNLYYVNKVEPIILPLKEDGWITLIHVVLPKKLNSEGYYFDGTSLRYNELYIDTQELITLALINNSPLNAEVIDIVNYCYIYNCYINLCKLEIEKYKCNSCNTMFTSLALLLRIFILALKIYMEFEMFEKALELIELINGCGMCGNLPQNCNCK